MSDSTRAADPGPDGELRSMLEAARRAGASAPAPPPGELLNQVESDERGLGALRSLATQTRLAIGVVVASLIVIVVTLLTPRADLESYPVVRMVATLGGLAGVALGSLALMVRGVDRDRSPWPLFATVLSGALAAPVLMGLMPEPASTGNDAPADFWRAAFLCASFGFVVVLPWVYVAGRLIRTSPPSRSQAMLLSGFAGLLAASTLQLHCPVDHGMHISVGHGLVGIAYALLFACAYWLLGRFSR